MFLSTGIAFLLGSAAFPGEPAVAPKPMVEIAAGYRVINRKLEPVEADNVFVASDMVVVWTSLVGVDAGFIEHVWLHDGVEVARHYLPVVPTVAGGRGLASASTPANTKSASSAPTAPSW